MSAHIHPCASPEFPLTPKLYSILQPAGAVEHKKDAHLLVGAISAVLKLSVRTERVQDGRVNCPAGVVRVIDWHAVATYGLLGTVLQALIVLGVVCGTVPARRNSTTSVMQRNLLALSTTCAAYVGARLLMRNKDKAVWVTILPKYQIQAMIHESRSRHT